MTAAYRLKGAGWLIACGAIVLGFYLVSLRVAAERKKLEAVNARIALAERDIRALETEFDTRANLAQLERWNGDTLALAAPTAGQFVASGAALASIDTAAPPLSVGAAGGAVRMAALVVPAAVTPAAQPAPVPNAMLAALPTARVAPPVQPAPPPAIPPASVVRVAAVHLIAPGETSRSLARLAGVDHATPAHPRTVAMLDRGLLSDATLGDLLAKAKNEAGRR